jgi:hypothetical protein
MSFSSYEIVRRAIEFETPDRLPLKIDIPVDLSTHDLIKSDFAYVNWNWVGPGDRNQQETVDEWGCVWRRSKEDNMGQVIKHPLENWNDLAAYDWPDPDDPAFYEGMEHQFAGKDGQYVLTGIFMFLFERIHALRGFSNALIDLYRERDKIEALADRIVDFDLRIIANLSEHFGNLIHGMWFTEDWGTQENLMISPALWREIFKPRYQSVFDAVHSAGWHVWLHSDGHINTIIEDFLGLDVDVLNLQQPLVNGIDEIGKRFAGRVCFESTCDIQKTLPFGSPDEIRKESRQLLDKWATPKGGFILSVDENAVDLQFPKENVALMVETFLQHDPWLC